MEVGAAFGRATLAMLNETSSRVQVIANDLDERHLNSLISNYEKSATAKQPETERERRRLIAFCGSVPNCLDENYFCCEGNENEIGESNSNENENDSSITRTPQNKFNKVNKKITINVPLRAVLVANVLHFLSPAQIDKLAERLFNICAPGARIFISLDSPWTLGYLPLWPLFFWRWLFGSESPGYHSMLTNINSNVGNSEQSHTESIAINQSSWLRAMLPQHLRGIPAYHVMTPSNLALVFSRAGWRIDDARYLSGDARGNPVFASLCGFEMASICARKP